MLTTYIIPVSYKKHFKNNPQDKQFVNELPRTIRVTQVVNRNQVTFIFHNEVFEHLSMSVPFENRKLLKKSFLNLYPGSYEFKFIYSQSNEFNNLYPDIKVSGF